MMTLLDTVYNDFMKLQVVYYMNLCKSPLAFAD